MGSAYPWKLKFIMFWSDIDFPNIILGSCKPDNISWVMADIAQKLFALPYRSGVPVPDGVGVLKESSRLTESKEGRRVQGGVDKSEESQDETDPKDECTESLLEGQVDKLLEI